MNSTQALQILQLRNNGNAVSASQVEQLLGNASVTFAQITYVTKVQLAAAHKALEILKVTSANVMLCSNIAAHTSVYARKVRRTAAALQVSPAAAVDAFAAQQNYFVHTGCYSVVQHAQHAHKQYLYAIYNRARSVYMHNGVEVSRQFVAEHCTPSAAKELLAPKEHVHNVTHNVTHSVRVRTIALDNIVSIVARKQLLTV